MARVLRIAASYESRSAISRQLNRILGEVQSQGADTTMSFKVEEDAGTGIEYVEVQFVDEGNPEFAAPSVNMSIEDYD